jgi:hypothetical protein
MAGLVLAIHVFADASIADDDSVCICAHSSNRITTRQQAKPDWRLHLGRSRNSSTPATAFPGSALPS